MAFDSYQMKIHAQILLPGPLEDMHDKRYVFTICLCTGTIPVLVQTQTGTGHEKCNIDPARPDNQTTF